MHVRSDFHAQSLAHVVLTDQHGGERLTTVCLEAGDLLLADRGSCRRQALWEVLHAGGQIVVRLPWSAVPLQHEDGRTLDRCPWVNSLWTESAAPPVWMQGCKPRMAFRRIAYRLSPEAAHRAPRRHQRKARQNGHRPRHPWTEVLTNWLLVLTSLEATRWDAQPVLDLDRARWQMERLFQWIKQLVRVSRVRRSPRLSNEATLAALPVGWALMERQASHLRSQVCQTEAASALACASARPVSTWEVDAVLVQSLPSMLLGPWRWQQIPQKLDQITRVLTCHPQARIPQESSILEHLEPILALLPS